MKSGRATSRLLAVLGVLALVPGFALAVSSKTTRSKTTSVPAAPRTLDEALKIAARLPPAPESGVSISIAELETGQSIFEKNPTTPETIASVTKLFSTAAALHFLGPDYKFRTTFWRKGEIQEGGLLVGELLVVGGGDPNISGRFYDDNYNYVFDQWADGLARAGVSRVSGNLILNSGFFDSVSRHPEWREGQEARWYQAPISALSYNDNVVLVSIRPGAKAGKPAAVSIEPETNVVRPVSRARTVQKGRPRLAVRRSFGSDAVTISGTVPSRASWWSTPVAIDDAPAFFGSVLRNRIQAAGIPVLGQIVEKTVQPDNSWILVAETESGILPTIAVTNKRSQGFYAEQVFKTLAAEKNGAGSWPSALAVQKEFLSALGLDASHYDLRDGSGLSPQNRTSAADVVAFLRAMNVHPYGAQWKATLATGGDPYGTLRHRLRTPDIAGRVFAKTGSLSGVSTLAGYVTGASGKTYAFTILLNGSRVWDSNGHAYQDRILKALARFG